MRPDIHFDNEWPEQFKKHLDEDGPWANWELYKLSCEVQKRLAIPTFEGLQAPYHLQASPRFPISSKSPGR